MSISEYSDRKFKFISDPGHGWIEVPRKLLVLLNISDKISGFSYQDAHKVYLEEDRDASFFLNAFRKEFGEEPLLEEIYQENTFIRDLESFREI